MDIIINILLMLVLLVVGVFALDLIGYVLKLVIALIIVGYQKLRGK